MLPGLDLHSKWHQIVLSVLCFSVSVLYMWNSPLLLSVVVHSLSLLYFILWLLHSLCIQSTEDGHVGSGPLLMRCQEYFCSWQVSFLKVWCRTHFSAGRLSTLVIHNLFVWFLGNHFLLHGMHGIHEFLKIQMDLVWGHGGGLWDTGSVPEEL